MIHGTCSLCGGRVITPDMWGGIQPPIQACESCGATKAQPHGPVIQMEKPRKPHSLREMTEGDFVEAHGR
jgi:hypothetical protein